MLLNTARTLFPGAMGPDGFISCFDHLIDDSVLKRKLILKGGPGVGKSTFMRRVHAALCANGEASTLYFCSGDPDSLDGVSVPHAGLLILDGTAPHIVDPEIPGARDSIINLGECLDEPAMRPRLPHIRACMAAAATLARDNAATLHAATDEARLCAMTQALVQAVLAREAPKEVAPGVRPVITDAITPKGEISLISENAQPRVIRLMFHWGMDGTAVLRRLSAAVQAAGYSVEEHLCPIVPGRLLHLTIPALATLVTTGEQLAAEQSFDFAACIPQGALLRYECALEQGRAGIRLHLHRASAALAQAKQLHDELESFYVPNMDFEKWQTMLDRTLESLKN